MNERDWIGAQIENINRRMDKQDDILKGIAENTSTLINHQVKLDQFEILQQDQEKRIRDIEKYKLVLVIITGVIIAGSIGMFKQSSKLIDEAQKHRPMTSQEFINATSEALENVLNKDDKE
jgi:hypothetical protein